MGRAIHVVGMGQIRNAYNILVGNREGKRPLERRRRRWKDNIKVYLKEIWREDMDWIELAQFMVHWRTVRVPLKDGNFFTS